MQCLNVFAFGGSSAADDKAETGYYAVRLAITEAISQAAGKTLKEILPKLLVPILQRFNINVALKFSGQAVPVAGAATGIIINLAFMDHYHDKARGHFIVRRLERKYGATQVHACYEQLKLDWLAEKSGERKQVAA
jgi:hypothetical protein